MGKKIFLSILGVLLVATVGVVGYGAKIYFDVKGTVSEIQDTTVTRLKSEKREAPVEVDKGQPFSILLLGIDTGEDGRTEQGRSDTMIVATVSPKTNKTTFVSIARDTYTEIVGLGTMDKINHAYAFGGVEMSMNSVENLLNIPIDHYVSVNMKGLVDIVDAVGGVDVENTLEFSQGGYDFPLGTIHLGGEAALNYSRMRYEDPKGDYGRQQRQQKVVAAIMSKALSFSTLSNYKDILAVLEGNLKTDLSWDQMMDIQKNYRDAFKSVDHQNLQGVGTMRDGVSYQDIPADELARVQQLLANELAH